MADKKISELSELTTPAVDDILPVVDTSATLTKKIKLQTLFENAFDVKPAADSTHSLGTALLAWLNGHFDKLTLGGVEKSAWPSAVAGSNGEVLMSGAITLNGEDGVTITHSKGDTSYLIKVLPKELPGLGRVGEIVYVKSTNTAVVYNSGIAGILDDYELSAVI